ncbi:MAG: biotin carboxylase N-terminal domain-containing protein [Hyphomonadaceae bacterium]|nr:biotin carboxylase N-terminal domain-containing protein [Hyphomonadaceae bacterium]
MTAPFESVLVANRGEIACRIFRTARTLGVRTIAVYSDADAGALHTRSADGAVRIGAAPAAESYLRGDAILAAAREAGAAAIHPGYGFLSENPDFAEAVRAAGLVWIGPTPAAIRAMGLKDEAKRIAIAAGVPVLPGYQGEDQGEKRLLDEAKAIGFPVLIKAVAGGGGRGIREVRAAGEFKEQLASARREAKAAFGDDRVLIERLVQRPRHIEVQVFGDRHGAVAHLFERDCSLQRRRQKVIEEAPAPGMTPAVRAAMTDAAVKVARAVKYENAGTVEFIVDGEGPLRPDGFWFLEMNTRLQVEHPVTEAVTGLDLVAWQFAVAAGAPLPLRQEEITLTGHAVEARICAEDPSEGFRPSVGRLRALRFDGYSRVDAGFEAGDAIPAAYDSLIAKEITHAETREQALYHARVCLGRLQADGVATNGAFLQRCLADPDFIAGRVHTGLIAERIEALADRAAGRRRAAACAVLAETHRTRDAGVWARTDGWRLNGPPRRAWLLHEGGQTLRIDPGPPLTVDGEPLDLLVEWGDDETMQANVDTLPFQATILRRGDALVVLLAGETFTFETPGAAAAHEVIDGGDVVAAPLPGRIVGLTARVGDAVVKGAPLMTLEAMKMEHALKAPRDGVVAEVNAVEGAQVKEGAVLLRLAAQDATP